MKVWHGFIIAVLTVILLSFVGYAWKYFTAPIKGAVDAQVELESGNSRILKYNEFYDLYSNIETHAATIKAQKRLLNNTKDKEDISRIRTNIAALEAIILRDINQYNVNARKTFTKARFKPEDLPNRIEYKEFLN